ncbi:hypothetical protein RIR_jg39435.t1 [Rhizophagus irregularis DAOM 181602=DAOM 197198]|nr:hypothetical protein RIR_jg39435.t1 [Rhizophagus irregularis DAOM 181602=DAOM 197198]
MEYALKLKSSSSQLESAQVQLNKLAVAMQDCEDEPMSHKKIIDKTEENYDEKQNLRTYLVNHTKRGTRISLIKCSITFNEEKLINSQIWIIYVSRVSFATFYECSILLHYAKFPLYRIIRYRLIILTNFLITKA